MSEPRAEIRKATDSDLRFVAASWYDSHWSRWGKKHVSRALYHEGQGARIDRLIGRSDIYVAYFPEVPDEVLGWLCLDRDKTTLHYCYVKASYRRVGVASGLMSGHNVKWYSHSTDSIGGKFAEKFSLKYNPFHLES